MEMLGIRRLPSDVRAGHGEERDVLMGGDDSLPPGGAVARLCVTARVQCRMPPAGVGVPTVQRFVPQNMGVLSASSSQYLEP